MSGFSAPRIRPALGRDYLQVWHDLGAELGSFVDEACSGRSVDTAAFEHVVRSPDGGRFSLSYVPIRDPAGRVDGLWGTCTEIADQRFVEGERQEADATLRENEERQSFLLDLSDALRPLNTPTDIVEVAAGVWASGSVRAAYSTPRSPAA